MGLPVLSEAKSLAEVKEQTALIGKMATDLVAEPVVQEGYMLSGQPGQTAYINVMSMAKKRLLKIFPTADFHEPVFARLMAEAKYICANCIHLKYECRARNQPYDHIKDATISVENMVRRHFVEYSKTIKALEDADAGSQPLIGTEEPRAD